jgi:hypothetical protein
MNLYDWIIKQDFTKAERERVLKEFNLKEKDIIKEDMR